MLPTLPECRDRSASERIRLAENIPLVGGSPASIVGLSARQPKARLGSGDGGEVSSRIKRLRSRDRFNELNWFHPQRVRQFDDVDQPDVAFASLDSTDIVSMQVRQLRQAFLGKAALRPQFANASAE